MVYSSSYDLIEIAAPNLQDFAFSRHMDILRSFINDVTPPHALEGGSTGKNFNVCLVVIANF